MEVITHISSSSSSNNSRTTTEEAVKVESGMCISDDQKHQNETVTVSNSNKQDEPTKTTIPKPRSTRLFHHLRNRLTGRTSSSPRYEPVPTNESSSSQTTTTSSPAKSSLNTGLIHTCLSLFFLTFSWGITMPHLQSRRDALQCDASCYGGMTSLRSLLGLVGSTLIGWISDRIGRKFCLYLGCVATAVGLCMSVAMYSIEGLWLSMIPAALFASNASVCKALLADYHEMMELEEFRELKRGVVDSSSAASSTQSSSVSSANDESAADDSKPLQNGVSAAATASSNGSSPDNSTTAATPPANLSARSNSMGKMGMSAGLAIMIGPICGAALCNDYDCSIFIATTFSMISAIFVTMLPNIPSHGIFSSRQTTTTATDCQNTKKTIFRFQISSRVLSSPGPIFLMLMRICMSLAFHIFHIIWAPSLKRRFDFGPKDHGIFLSFLGLSYALSQGIIAKKILKLVPNPKQRSNILMISAFLLGLGRYLAFRTDDLRLIYVIFGILIITLGVVNTIVSADASGLVPSNEMGSLFGTLEAVESGAGIVGPMIGGALSLLDPIWAPLMAVVMLYGIVFCMVFYGYERFVLNGRAREGLDKVKK